MAVGSMDRDDLFRRRMRVAFLIILICYLGLVGRLVLLQGMHGPDLHAEATKHREERIRLPARLGSICDRMGRPLAVSLYSGSVGFDAREVRIGSQDLRAAARNRARLADSIVHAAHILDLPEAQLSATVCRAIAEDQTHPVRFYPIKSGLTMEQAQQFRADHGRLFGFGVHDGTQRVYSEGSNAAQVIGFLSSSGSGLDGLERGCRKWTAGTDGFAMTEVDDHKREIPDTLQQIQPAQEGLDIRTTLDADAQNIATEEARKVFEKFHPRGVSIVVLEPETGDIRALVSLPCYDANPLPDHPGRRPPLPVAALPERCVSSLYEPGSTLKALTISAALDEGLITPETSFYCSGQYKVGRHTIHCAHGEVHHDVNAEKILRYSCNVGAAHIGLILGGERLYEADRLFGLFDPIDIAMPNAQRGHWTLDSTEQPYNRPKAARAAFGQSIVTTPLHVALAYAAIANGGVLMKPRMVTALSDSSGHTVSHWEPQISRRVISARTAARVTAMLRSVVTEGTGRIAALPGYQIAGKTGTATKYRRDAYVGSFIGFMPASAEAHPRLLILVVVDEPDAHKAYYGADVAAPAFKAIASRLLMLWHISEDDPQNVQAHAAQDSLRRQGVLPQQEVARSSNDD